MVDDLQENHLMQIKAEEFMKIELCNEMQEHKSPLKY